MTIKVPLLVLVSSWRDMIRIIKKDILKKWKIKTIYKSNIFIAVEEHLH